MSKMNNHLLNLPARRQPLPLSGFAFLNHVVVALQAFDKLVTTNQRYDSRFTDLHDLVREATSTLLMAVVHCYDEPETMPANQIPYQGKIVDLAHKAPAFFEYLNNWMERHYYATFGELSMIRSAAANAATLELCTFLQEYVTPLEKELRPVIGKSYVGSDWTTFLRNFPRKFVMARFPKMKWEKDEASKQSSQEGYQALSDIYINLFMDKGDFNGVVVPKGIAPFQDLVFQPKVLPEAVSLKKMAPHLYSHLNLEDKCYAMFVWDSKNSLASMCETAQPPILDMLNEALTEAESTAEEKRLELLGSITVSPAKAKKLLEVLNEEQLKQLQDLIALGEPAKAGKAKAKAPAKGKATTKAKA